MHACGEPSRRRPGPAPSLPAAVDALHSRLEEEAQEWRRLQTGAAKTGAQLEVGRRRLPGHAEAAAAVLGTCHCMLRSCAHMGA